VPGPKPRLHLPFAEWPAADRRLWNLAFCINDPFSNMHLSKASQEGCMWSWRRFLGFLKNSEPEALETSPAERLTMERVKRLVAHLRETNAPSSVAAVVESLYIAARAMMPNHDWGWLKQIKARLHAAAPARSPAKPVITSVQLLETGLALMEENKPRPNEHFDRHKAVAYRNGFMSALVAFVPIRPRNLTSLEIGRHLVREGDRWFIIIPREETKTTKRIQFELPAILIPYLTLYLEVVRRRLIRGKSHNALWVSAFGGPLSYVGFVKSFAALSTRFGVRISPHDCRDAAVTTWAIARPDQIAVSRDLLYHSKLGTTGLYNRVRGIEASRAYRQVISQIRRQRRRPADS